MQTNGENSYDFAVITPSFAPDFARCQLLNQSIERFSNYPYVHYIIIDQQDLQLFSQLESANTRLITVESVLPWWIRRLPMARRWWMSFKSLPIRNWFLQQVVKLSIGLHLEEEVMVFIDSDVALIRPFSFADMVRGDQVRLFRVPGSGQTKHQAPWHRAAGRLLGLPLKDYYEAKYIGNMITWRRSNVIKLHRHMEAVSGRGWLENLCRRWHLSEYILYGVFADQVLKEESGHYYEEENICHEYWIPEPLSDQQLKEFFAKAGPDHIAAMISAKARIPVDRYRSLLEKASAH